MTSAVLSTIWMPSAEELARLGPLWCIAATIVAILLGALIGGRNWRLCGILAVTGGLLTAWLCYRNFAHPTTWAGLTPKSEGPMLVVDPFSNFFIFLISLFLVLITGMWCVGQSSDLTGLRTQRKDAVEFFVLFIGSAFGMALMVSTTNLLMIILAVESASLPSYGLAGFRKKHRPAAEASLKYILFGAVTSAIMIYGASLLYGSFHTLDLATIGERIALEGVSLLQGVAIFAFLVGVGFKVSAVPFHFWAPDVFEGATIEVTTWLSVASKAAGIGLMLRIVSVLTASLNSPEALRNISLAIAILAALTCTVGNFSAFRQTNLKRLLGFSSIAHAGYMLMAAAILWVPAASPDADVAANPAFSAVIAYMVVYLLMNLGAFGCVALVYWATGKETLDAFNGLGRRAPLLAVVMAVCLFSLVGLPPFGGFIAKWYLLLALFDAKLIWLVFVAVFNTLISLYYYARIAYAMYFTDDGQPTLHTAPLGQVSVAICAVGILLTGTFAAGRLKSFSDARSRDAYAQQQTPRNVIAEKP
ncbi:MAG TPA: NADH-quinone oxidoreductase subunit N [Phycisphaerae bacterium]|nr:NADH-quinone oxidoreductase subunit N [Phycisphaerae bacterium]